MKLRQNGQISVTSSPANAFALTFRRYFARVMDVFPSRSLVRWHSKQAEKASQSSSSPVKAPASADIVHRIGCNLDMDNEEAVKTDDPEDYIYSVQLIDEEGQFTGSIMEARLKQLSRDRLTFSKAILKRYLRECVVRDSTVGSPWVVRHNLAHRYGIAIAPSAETVEKNNAIKEQKLSRRKRVQEEEQSATPAGAAEESKAAAQAAAATAAAAAAANKKMKKTKAEKEAAKAEQSTASLKQETEEEKQKKKPLKFPIEDLEVDPISERELKAKIIGEVPRRRDRPPPSRDIGISLDFFEPLMVTYHFLQAFGKPLMLAPFTLDDYTAALEHQTHQPSCTLITEIHACLINLIVRDAMQTRNGKHMKSGAAANGAKDRRGSPSSDQDEAADEEEEGEEDEEEEESGDELDSREATPESTPPSEEGQEAEEPDAEDARPADTALLNAANAMSKGWDSRTLKLEEGRHGWEVSLIGALAKDADTAILPRVLAIVSHLTGKEHPDGIPESSGTTESMATPRERYPKLSIVDKISVIHFLCDLAVMTQPVKLFFEKCETTLTALRKERVELGRQRKKIAEERAAEEKKDEMEEGEGEEEVKEEDGGEEATGEDSVAPVNDSQEEAAETSNATINGSKRKAEAGSSNKRKRNGVTAGAGSRGGRKRGGGPRRGGRGAQRRDQGVDDGDNSEHDELESSPEVEQEEEEEEDDKSAARATANGKGRPASDSDREASSSPEPSIKRGAGSRQQALEEKRQQRLADEAARQKRLAQEREEQRQRTAENKRLNAERLRWETEEDRITAREEEIDREFRRFFMAPRMRPMGKDRFHDRYWWFDGIGTQTLVGPNGNVQYGTGRLFVQGASQEDWDAACVDRSLKAMIRRRQEEHGSVILAPDEWAVYDRPEAIEELIAWLRNKGNRETVLKKGMLTFRGQMAPGMAARLRDVDPESYANGSSKADGSSSSAAAAELAAAVRSGSGSGVGHQPLSSTSTSAAATTTNNDGGSHETRRSARKQGDAASSNHTSNPNASLVTGPKTRYLAWTNTLATK